MFKTIKEHIDAELPEEDVGKFSTWNYLHVVLVMIAMAPSIAVTMWIARWKGRRQAMREIRQGIYRD